MSISPLVSVVIVNWNGRHLLVDCMSALFQQTFHDFEVIVVDNGSSDGSPKWISENYPQTRLICLRENYGFCGGNNAGIREARGEYVVLLNNDTQVETGWLEPLVEMMETDNRIAACDSKISYFDKRDTIWTCGGDYSIAGTVHGRGNLKLDGFEFTRPENVFTAVACSTIYRKKTFNEIGMLDEDFFTGYEDVDWSFRAHLRGYRIVNVPASRVYHKVSASQGNNSESFVYYGQRNVLAVFVKNMPSPLLVKYFPVHMLYMLGSLAYFARIGRGRAFLRAKRDIVRQWPALWLKRQQVQSQRTVSAAEIDALLSRDWLGAKIKKARKVSLG